MMHTPELLTEIPFELSGKIYRSPMPFGPYDRQNQVWALYQEKGINQVVILVEMQEYFVHAQMDLPKFYRSHGLDVIHYPIHDFQVPENDDGFSVMVHDVLTKAQAGSNTAVHCLAGIGRTGIFLACLAKRQHQLAGQAAIDWVRQFIPEALEVPEQEEFVFDF